MDKFPDSPSYSSSIQLSTCPRFIQAPYHALGMQVWIWQHRLCSQDVCSSIWHLVSKTDKSQQRSWCCHLSAPAPSQPLRCPAVPRGWGPPWHSFSRDPHPWGSVPRLQVSADISRQSPGPPHLHPGHPYPPSHPTHYGFWWFTCILSALVWKCHGFYFFVAFTNVPPGVELCGKRACLCSSLWGPVPRTVPGTWALSGTHRVREWMKGENVGLWSQLTWRLGELPRGGGRVWERSFIIGNPCSLTYMCTSPGDWGDFSSPCGSLTSALRVASHFLLSPLI